MTNKVLYAVFCLAALAVASAVSEPATDRVRGLVAATFTPISANNTIETAVVPAQAKYLADTGVFWAFVSGTTGESVDLDTEERKAMTEAWVKHGPVHNVSLLIHVGAESIKTSRDLAAHAAQFPEVWGVAAMPPTFFKPPTVEALVDTIAAIAAECPDKPFYYYHIPSKTGVDFDMFDFLTLADTRIPNLNGIKFTHWDLSDLIACVNFKGGKYNILYGMDQQLLGGLISGVDGAVGSTYNFNGVLQNRVIDAFKAGDLAVARAAQLDSANFCKVLLKFCSTTATWCFKVAQNIINEPNVGYARLPYLQPTKALETDMRGAMKQWCSTASYAPPWCQTI